MSESPEIAELIARCLEGVASDEDVAKLDVLIARDPNVARALARAATVESNLETVARTHPQRAPVEKGRVQRRWTWWAVGVTAFAAGAVLAVTSLRREPVPVVAETTDETTTAAGAESETARPAAAEGPASPTPVRDDRRVRFQDGSVAELRDGASRLETRVETGAALDVALTNGGARFEVARQRGRRFRVWVGATYVEVIGTVFTVDRLAGAVRVSVERGLVKIVSGRTETRVAAGGTQVVGLEKPRPGATKETARDEVGEWLHASEVARRDGHPEHAFELLRRVLDRHHGDPRAPYASFIMGRVLLEELARPREAAAAFARVELLDPKTPLVQDALAREVESWARAGDEAKSRARARLYLGRYPDGARADEVRRYSRME